MVIRLRQGYVVTGKSLVIVRDGENAQRSTSNVQRPTFNEEEGRERGSRGGMVIRLRPGYVVTGK
jgi:hypothetical protein